MDILSQIVGKVVDCALEPLGRQVGYLYHCKRNLQNLKTQVRDLGAARESVHHKVVEEKDKGRTIETYVNNWLADVDKITGQANEILADERQGKMKCLYGFCPNPKLRHQLSRKSTKLVQEVVDLYGKKDFTSFAYDVRPQEVCATSTKDYEAFNSRDSIVKEIMDELRNPTTADIIGLYGIGGVGKTTLVKQVYRQATKDTKLFDDVVMVLDVKKNPDLETIQKEIAQQLGMDFVENISITEKGRRLCHRIKDKKVLVILDDIWEIIDLEAVGLPHVETCKILLTSRSRIVLSSYMGTQKDFPLNVLDEEETWRLFEKMSGDVVKDPAIREVATKVAKKCGGLPVLVVTVARALKNRSKLDAWKDALRRLKGFDREEELTKKACMTLEWSYDQLDDKELKPLFLLCGISGLGRNHIYLSDLLKYGMGLGLFKNVNTVEESRNLLHSLIEKLKDSCLLLEVDDTSVRMHDLVRDVANRIAVRDQHVLSEDGGELKEWPNNDFFKKCTRISLRFGNIPRLPEVVECPELEMFILFRRDDDLMGIPCNFFKEMKKLKVLDLTDHRFPSLPSSFQFLKNLQTLCLDACLLGDITLVGQLTNLQILSFINSKVDKLPKEIGQLTHLRLLDLSNCQKLEVISPNVISSLKRLEDLRMRNSFNKWEAEGVNGERSNASLLELKHLSQLTSLEICIPDASILPADLFSDRLERYQIFIGDLGKQVPKKEKILNTLQLKLTTTINEILDQSGLKTLLKRCEDLYLDGAEGVNDIIYQLNTERTQQLKHLHLHLRNNVDFTYIINRKVGLLNLTTLSVHECGDLRFLLSSSMATSLIQLKHLEISACEIMEEIVSTKERGEENMDNMFCKLVDMRLKNLPNLARFCTGSYIDFSLLKNLELVDCPKLGAFIFDPLSKNTTICKERSSKENLDVHTAVQQYFLFDEKVGFPSLEKLVIGGLSKLMTIWHNQLAPYSFCRLSAVEVFNCDNLINIFVSGIIGGLNALDNVQLEIFNCQNLDSITIHKCPRLKSIFPASVARCLRQLQRLEVWNCDEVEEIVAKEEGPMPKFVFPKVTFVKFSLLPQLRIFYPAMHASKWPLLKHLAIIRCDKVEIFAMELSIFQEKQSFFLIEKGSFPNLEWLTLGKTMEIWYGPPFAEFFPELRKFQTCAPFSKQSVVVLQKLHNLEVLSVTCDSCKEIFVHEENSCGEIHATRVTRLHLYYMYQLIHLGNYETSQAAGPVFPHLEILEVVDCPRLKNLESSAISFKNLTALLVVGCHGLKYLSTYPIAKSLMQLTTMRVLCCKRMKEIVAISKEEDDHAGNEIAFSRLQHLTLGSLPSLQAFCLENCIVKFPSLQALCVTRCLKLKLPPELQSVRMNIGDAEDDFYLDRYANGR